MDAANYTLKRIESAPGLLTNEEFEEEEKYLSEESKKEIDEAIRSAEEEIKAEEEKAQEAELVKGFEDYPEEPVTYKGVIGDNDFFIDLIVDFEEKEVSGAVHKDWGTSYLVAEIRGTIDLFRYSIEANCNGYFIDKETDTSEEANMKINGYLSENLNNFSGSLVVEDFGTKAFTATRE